MVESLDIAAIKRPNGWSPIRRELDVRSFGINAWSGDGGATLVGFERGAVLDAIRDDPRFAQLVGTQVVGSS